MTRKYYQDPELEQNFLRQLDRPLPKIGSGFERYIYFSPLGDGWRAVWIEDQTKPFGDDDELAVAEGGYYRYTHAVWHEKSTPKVAQRPAEIHPPYGTLVRRPAHAA